MPGLTCPDCAAPNPGLAIFCWNCQHTFDENATPTLDVAACPQCGWNRRNDCDLCHGQGQCPWCAAWPTDACVLHR